MSIIPLALGFFSLAGAFALGWRLSPGKSHADLIALLDLVRETLNTNLNRVEHPLSDRLSETIASAQALSAQAHGQAVAKPVGMPRGAAPPGRRDFSNLRKQ